MNACACVSTSRYYIGHLQGPQKVCVAVFIHYTVHYPLNETDPHTLRCFFYYSRQLNTNLHL